MADETTRTNFSTDDDTVHVHTEADGEEYQYSGTRGRAEYVADQIRSTARDVVDGLLRRVPPDVVEHVNNSRKEMLLAFRSLIDRELSSIDKCTRHAQDLHKEKEEEQAAEESSRS